MRKKIVCLTNYKGNFGSKWKDSPYRSGFDKKLLKNYFGKYDFNVDFVSFTELDLNQIEVKNQIFLYTSSEDIGYHYKNFIEDIILGIEDRGGIVLPSFKYLRANNNKVFMEILRKNLSLPGNENFTSHHFGTLEDLLKVYENFKYPVVFKLAEGSMGSNVELAGTKDELVSIVKKFCRTKYLNEDIRDYGRAIKRKGYQKESLYRKKFIVQSFIPDLKNDWKVYVFYDKYFIFYRPIFEHRVFKASGGGYDNYFYGKNAHIQEGIFDFAEKVYNSLNIPNVSMDIGYDGKSFYLFEFQGLFFGTAGIIYSDEYFTKNANGWKEVKNEKDIEKTYVESVVKFVENKLS